MSKSELSDSAEVRRESVKTKCQQTHPAFFGVALIVITLLVSHRRDEPIAWVLIWVVPVVVALLIRLWYGLSVLKRLDTLSDADIIRIERKLTYSSIINQALVGCGIWIAGNSVGETTLFVVTLIIGFYALGAMINLSSDFHAFIYSIPFLMGQPIIYWLLQEMNGAGISVALLVLTVLMVSAVWHSSRTFKNSVMMRFEKNQLLARVESEREKAYEALQAAQEANRSKAFFMAAASHDLRQPLYAISILSETLSMEELPSSTKPILDKQLQAIGTLSELFDNLLDLSKFESGLIVPQMKTVWLHDILKPLDMEFAQQCEAKGLKWECEYPRDVSVKTDAPLLSRMLRNILSNALCYTHEGGISLQVQDEGPNLQIKVADTGPGISEQDQARIFDEYVQLYNPQRNRNKGVGLGLAIVKYINGILHTDLKLDSELGRGTTISIAVPVVKREREFTSEPYSIPSINLSAKDLKLWVVEDDPLVQSALSMQFDKWGCDYKIFSAGDECLEHLSRVERRPDVLILDDMLGERDDGLELADRVKGKMETERILIVTGNSNPSRLQELEQSPYTIMIKPISSSKLGDWIVSLFGEKVTA